MQGKYIAPEYQKEDFHCPNCDVYVNQQWMKVYFTPEPYGKDYFEFDRLKMAHCNYCDEFSIWLNEKLMYPSQITAPRAHDDMPASVSEYYNEAREVFVSSPRAAAALLRIAIKKLCESLGEDEPNLNRAIRKLRQKGLPQEVIDSLHIVRIIGNEGGAHDGQIDLRGEDNKDIVDKLFRLVNFIVEKTITEPKAIESLRSSLSEDKIRGIEQRDKKR